MKPRRGEKAPTASSSRSWTERSESWSDGRVLASARRASRSLPSATRFTSSPPYGLFSSMATIPPTTPESGRERGRKRRNLRCEGGQGQIRSEPVGHVDARKQHPENEQRDAGEEPVVVEDEADGDDQYPDHGSQDQEQHPPPQRRGGSEDEPGHEEETAHRDSGREGRFHDPCQRPDPRGHCAASAMRRPTSRSTTAMMIFSERASTLWLRRAPSRLPGRAPTATAAVGCSA